MQDTVQLAHLKAAFGHRYRIQRELGSGGMATVYLAEEHTTSSSVTRIRTGRSPKLSWSILRRRLSGAG
jgi:serine/threonine protein kinase